MFIKSLVLFREVSYLESERKKYLSHSFELFFIKGLDSETRKIH